MPYNFADDSFTQRNFVADFLQKKSTFIRESAFFAFLTALLGSSEAAYDVHLRLIGKCIEDFLLVIIEVFSPDVMAEMVQAIQY